MTDFTINEDALPVFQQDENHFVAYTKKNDAGLQLACVSRVEFDLPEDFVVPQSSSGEGDPNLPLMGDEETGDFIISERVIQTEQFLGSLTIPGNAEAFYKLLAKASEPSQEAQDKSSSKATDENQSDSSLETLYKRHSEITQRNNSANKDGTALVSSRNSYVRPADRLRATLVSAVREEYMAGETPRLADEDNDQMVIFLRSFRPGERPVTVVIGKFEISSELENLLSKNNKEAASEKIVFLSASHGVNPEKIVSELGIKEAEDLRVLSLQLTSTMTYDLGISVLNKTQCAKESAPTEKEKSEIIMNRFKELIEQLFVEDAKKKEEALVVTSYVVYNAPTKTAELLATIPSQKKKNESKLGLTARFKKFLPGG